MLKSDEVKSLMERRIAVSPDEVSEAVLRDAGCWPKVAILPESLNERLSNLADLLVQAIPNTKDEDLRFIVGRLGQSLSYMMNSASWREGKLHDFDRDEIQRKLSGLFASS